MTTLGAKALVILYVPFDSMDARAAMVLRGMADASAAGIARSATMTDVNFMIGWGRKREGGREEVDVWM